MPNLERLMQWVAALAGAAAIGGCGVPTNPAVGTTLDATGVIVGDLLLGGTRPHHPRPLSQGLGGTAAHVIFLNFDGVTLQPSYDDASRNLSSIAQSQGANIVVPPFDYQDYATNRSRAQIINDVVASVQGLFQDFDVAVVATRPQSGSYVMTAVGGLPDLIGQPCQGGGGSWACVAGIAPLDCQRSNQGIVYNQQGDVEVVFAFAATQSLYQLDYATALSTLTTTIGQETAHAYGLGHEDAPGTPGRNGQPDVPGDVMNPTETIPGATFMDKPFNYADSFNCAGGQGTQNSHALLIQILGPSQGMTPVDNIPPTVRIALPTKGSIVDRSFTVKVSGSDNVGVDHIDLHLSGPETNAITLMGGSGSWNIAVTTDGSYGVSATAFDAAGNSATDSVSFTVKSGAMVVTLAGFGVACTANADCKSNLCAGGICTFMCGSCPSHYHCTAERVCAPGDGIIITPMPDMRMPQALPGAVGAPCAQASQCHSNLCADNGAFHFCTDRCNPADATSCPSWMYCADQGADGHFCAFVTASPGASGCSVGGAPASPSSAAWTLLLLALPLARRRRRR